MLTGQRNVSWVGSLFLSVKILITWTYLQGSKKPEFQLVLWASSSHILLAQGHFLLDLVNDFIRRWLAYLSLTCKQALCGAWVAGRETEGELATHLWNLDVCIEKVDAKCWLAEMTLVMTSLPLARAFQCLFTLVLVSVPRWLAEIWQFSQRGATGELEVEFKFQRHCCKFSFLFQPRCQRESLLTG